MNQYIKLITALYSFITPLFVFSFAHPKLYYLFVVFIKCAIWFVCVNNTISIHFTKPRISYAFVHKGTRLDFSHAFADIMQPSYLSHHPFSSYWWVCWPLHCWKILASFSSFSYRACRIISPWVFVHACMQSSQWSSAWVRSRCLNFENLERD